jgi:general secretion pathway protein C
MTDTALPSLPPWLLSAWARAQVFYRRHGALLPPLATLLLAMVLAAQLAALFWTLMPLPERARWAPAPGFVDPGQAKTAVNADSLATAHLFGQYEAVATNTSLANAPDTQLAFTLIGILSGSREKESRALISKDNDDGAPYAIGQDVAPGISLQAIFPDRVILSRQGKLETLRLDKDAPSSNIIPQGPSTVSGEAQEGTPAAAAMLSQIKSQVLTDPSKAANFIRVQPMTGEGGIKGYRVYPGPERNGFNASGLKPGDVVTAINGVPLSDQSQALQLLQNLSTASQVTLSIDRNGASQTVSVSAGP